MPQSRYGGGCPRPLGATSVGRLEPAGARAASSAAPAAGAGPGGPLDRELRDAAPLWPLLLGCLGLAALSLLLPAAPTYDPWAWLVWGREITELDLNTRLGPSWKPLPVLFTTVFALAGDHAPDLWLLVARAGGLLALVMAYRVAALLAGRFAGAMAAAGLLLTERWLRDTTLSNSEPLLVALVLWAVSEHLTGRRGRALALGFGAGLLRPEIWPFLGLYGLFLWFREPRWRARMAGLALLMPILWFLPEALGSGDALRASTRARTPNPDSPAFAPRPALEILRLFWPLTIAPVKAGAVAGVVLALVAYVRRRRHGATLALAAGGLAWLGLVAVMTEAGYAGNVRYLMLAAAIFCVVAGIGFASMAEALGHLAGGGRRGRVAAAAALTAVAAVLAVPRATWLVGDAIDLNLEAELYDDIPVAVARAGGAERLLDCGRPFTGPYQVPSIAWHLHVHTSTVTHIPQPRGVAFRPRPGSGENPRFGVPKAPFRRLASSTKWDVFAACDPGWSKARRRFEASAGASAGRLASRR